MSFCLPAADHGFDGNDVWFAFDAAEPRVSRMLLLAVIRPGRQQGQPANFWLVSPYLASSFWLLFQQVA
jgi:hypothetical protein